MSCNASQTSYNFSEFDPSITRWRKWTTLSSIHSSKQAGTTFRSLFPNAVSAIYVHIYTKIYLYHVKKRYSRRGFVPEGIHYWSHCCCYIKMSSHDKGRSSDSIGVACQHVIKIQAGNHPSHCLSGELTKYSPITTLLEICPTPTLLKDTTTKGENQLFKLLFELVLSIKKTTQRNQSTGGKTMAKVQNISHRGE